MKRLGCYIGVTFGILCIIASLGIMLFLYSFKKESDTVQNVTNDVIQKYINDNEGTENNINLVDLLCEAFSNEDVIAYIYFPEANISYPIVQGSDNTKYLNTNIWGEYSANGSIFLDSTNTNDFSDTSSVIYGHHMRNGGMFGSLESTCSKGIQGVQFSIYTRTNKLVYSIKSTEVINPNVRNEYIHLGEYNTDEFCRYLQNNASLYEPTVKGNKFVTLITCHYLKGETYRYGVTGALISNTTYNKEAF